MGVMTAIAAAGVISGAITAGQAGKRADSARDAANLAAAEINAIKSKRQPIINPYAGVTNLSNLGKDLSGMMSNPFANLGVATQAAEMKVEQSNLALSNALETLATTGASAGGATALAQAALASKKGVSASIEQQEAQNQKLRAQGEQQLEQVKMSEAQRLQGLQISEGQRVQSAEAAGQQYMMGLRENRTNADLGRAAGQEANALQQQYAAQAAQSQAWGGAISGAISGVASVGIANIGTSTADKQIDFMGNIVPPPS